MSDNADSIPYKPVNRLIPLAFGGGMDTSISQQNAIELNRNGTLERLEKIREAAGNIWHRKAHTNEENKPDYPALRGFLDLVDTLRNLADADSVVCDSGPHHYNIEIRKDKKPTNWLNENVVGILLRKNVRHALAEFSQHYAQDVSIETGTDVRATLNRAIETLSKDHTQAFLDTLELKRGTERGPAGKPHSEVLATVPWQEKGKPLSEKELQKRFEDAEAILRYYNPPDENGSKVIPVSAAGMIRVIKPDHYGWKTEVEAALEARQTQTVSTRQGR